MEINPHLLLILSSSTMADAEPDLGQKLMRSFLTVLLEEGPLPARLICMGSGIFLTTEGSPVLDLVMHLEKAGTEILSCSTCLNYYGRRDRLMVGRAGTMRDMVQAMFAASKVLRP